MREISKNVFKTVKAWDDDLIWCPSQCYLNIEYLGRHFVIYLRWRWSNPWTADIVECPNDGKFDMHELKDNWHELNIKYWEDKQLKEAKENAIEAANKWLKEIKAP